MIQCITKRPVATDGCSSIQAGHPSRSSASLTTGFTLIESLLYIALFTIVVGGGILTAVALIESSGNTRQRTAIEAEGNFIMKKLDLVINGSTIILPASGNTGTTLSLARAGETYDVVFSGTTITLSRNGGAGVPLNTENAPASGVAFTHSAGPPEGVEYTFLLGEKQFGPKVHYAH